MLNRIRVSAFLRLMVRKEFDETLMFELSWFCKIGGRHKEAQKAQTLYDSNAMRRFFCWAHFVLCRGHHFGNSNR